MPTFAETLQRTLAGKVGAYKLSNLTGIPRGTIESWLQGRVQYPRTWQPILVIAQALLLNREAADTLLQAAHHPTIAELATQVVAGHPDRVYLQPWLTTTPLPPSARHQLRAPVGDFVGRTAEVAGVRAALLRASESSSAVAISGVQGMGGIGKTELAYKVAQTVRQAFPDAQIVLTLRGSTPTPMPPEQALQSVIRAFQPESKLPDDLPALEAIYRSQLDTRRVLILADDAASAAQVEPLLPPAGSALLLTSRVRFTLPAMTTIDLEQLVPTEAIDLLRSICPRLDAEQATRLARACGYLPLALRLSAGLLQNTPALAVAEYLTRLGDERHRLAHLRDPNEPQRDVEATLSFSYTQLDGSTQTMFRHLGVLVADFVTSLAQAVVAVPEGGDVTTLLYQLQRRNLILYDAECGRWRLHDLVRDLARQRLETAGEAEAVQWRYARATVALAEQIQEQYLAGGEKALLALSQFDTERAHIDAARRWMQRTAGTPAGDQLLIDAARAFSHIKHLRYDPQQESIPLWEQVRMAARRLGDQAEEALALNHLGDAYSDLGELHPAISYYRQCLDIARTTGNRPGQGIALRNLGIAYARLGEAYTAISYYEQALPLFRDLGDRREEAYALACLGEVYHNLSGPHTVITYQKQALVIAREIGDLQCESLTLRNLGFAYMNVGNTRHMLEYCEAALSISRAIGDRRGEAYTLSFLARAQAIQGDRTRARTSFTQAMTLFQEVSNRWGAAVCQWLFGLALMQHGEREQALPLLRAAVAYGQAIGRAKAAENTALIARLEAGEELPAHLRVPTDQHAIGDNSDGPTGDDPQL